MDKKVIVKQNTGFRIFWIFLSLVIFAFSILMLIVSDGWIARLVSCAFLILLIAPIYYWRWELVLYKDKISFRRIFGRHEYSYSQIKSVKEYDHGRSRSDGLYLMIYLHNGKKIKVFSNYLNFDKCRNELLKHMSIQYKRISWCDNL